MADERRSDERVPLPLEVHWESLSGKREARLSDVSVGGCYVESLGQVAVGEHIDFEIQLPTGRWLSLRGEVAYYHPNLGFGVRFTELSETERNILASVIEYGRET